MSSCEIIEGITLHHGDCRDIREWADKGTATRMCSHKVYGAGEPVTDEAKAWAGWGGGFAGRSVSTCAYAKRVYILYACITAPPVGAGGLAFSVGKAPFHFMRCASLPHRLR